MRGFANGLSCPSATSAPSKPRRLHLENALAAVVPVHALEDPIVEQVPLDGVPLGHRTDGGRGRVKNPRNARCKSFSLHYRRRPMRRFVKLKTTHRNDLTVHRSRTLLEQKQLEPERLSALFHRAKRVVALVRRRSPLSFHSASLRARHPRLSIVGSPKKPHTAFTATCATGLHVLCQSQSRRVLSKISQLNRFAQLRTAASLRHKL